MPQPQHIPSSAAVLIRMSPDQRRRLAEVAAENGMTVRAWVMYRALGVEHIEPGKPGRKPNRQAPLPIDPQSATA